MPPSWAYLGIYWQGNKVGPEKVRMVVEGVGKFFCGVGQKEEGQRGE